MASLGTWIGRAAQAVDIADRTAAFGLDACSMKVDYDLFISADGVNSRVRCCYNAPEDFQCDCGQY